MSNREYVDFILDRLSEEQMQGLLQFICGFYSDEIPNQETMMIIDDVNNNKNLSKEFHSVTELMEDLNADD